MNMTSTDTVWARIKAGSGEEFRQIRGKTFTYEVRGSAVIPEGVNQNIPRAHFEAALELLPLGRTVPIQHFRGPSYIYAVLISQDSEIGRMGLPGSIAANNALQPAQLAALVVRG